MVFPSLMFNVEPGTVSQFSAFAVIAFSFILHRIKKIALISLLILGSILFFSLKVHSYAVMPSHTYNQNWPPMGPYMNNFNYYGRPWGYAPPAYFYPQLQFHSIWGPQQPYYFNPHPQSPYAPIYDCPFCGQQQQQPVFPYPVIHPGGGVS